ncbi:MAG TPA: exodeoxyribonuclease VII large subunit, partial [Bacteroidales bacterium]|nr:exodeoxyribonuclease VII large subunit [Bacteroidales bacterium]
MMNDQYSLFQDRQIYSLHEVAEHIREALEAAFPDFYWIRAEIAKLNFYPKSGHCYVDLVEKRDKATRAEMRATIWASNYQMITTKFRQQTRENLRDGMMILFLASVSFHEVYGLSLNIIDVEPSFTVGEMAREKRMAIEILKKEGIFDHNRKLTLPLLPGRIALISVETSKGYHDFVTSIENNPYGYGFHYQLFPSLLQGEKAIVTMTEQLKNISRRLADFDAVAIIRGGGGEVGLSAYDNYELARQVAAFPLPVI